MIGCSIRSRLLEFLVKKYAVLVLCLLLLLSIGKVVGRVNKDEEKKLESGTTRVFLGVVTGEISLIKQGIEEGGNIYSSLEPYIGEKVLKLGLPYVDFPVCPPIHMTFNYGLREHLNAAVYLSNQYVDINDYRLPTFPPNLFERGYPPALLFALGFGQKPNNSHAAFIQRYFRTFEDRFNFSKIEAWRQQTNNPPLLHITVALDNFDGTYVLLSEMSKAITVHHVDQFNMTALHYAAWFGQIQSAILLLYNGAALQAVDQYHHTALHLAIMRNQLDIAALLFGSAINQISSNSLDAARKTFLSLLQARGLERRDILELLLLAPTHLSGIYMVEHFAGLLNLSLVADVASSSLQRQMLQHILYERREVVDWRSQIDLVTNILPDYFLRHYFIPQRPLLIADAVTVVRGMGVWAYMDDPGVFIERYGGRRVAGSTSFLKDVMEREITAPWVSLTNLMAAEGEVNATEIFHQRFSSPSTDTLEQCMDEASEKEMMVAAINEPGSCGVMTEQVESRIPYAEFLQHYSTDFTIPSIFNICHDNSLHGDFALTVGAAGSAGRLTQRNASYHVLLRGHKVWTLLRPGITVNQSLLADLSDRLGANTSDWSSLSGQWFLWRALPILQRHHLAINVEQRIGEVLYIPADWVALEANIEDSLGLSHEFCIYTVTDVRVPPLGYHLYGVKDPLAGVGFPRTHFKSNYSPGLKYSNRKKAPIFEYPHIT